MPVPVRVLRCATNAVYKYGSSLFIAASGINLEISLRVPVNSYEQCRKQLIILVHTSGSASNGKVAVLLTVELVFWPFDLASSKLPSRRESRQLAHLL